MKELIRGYWCECWTEHLTEPQRPSFLALFDAYSAAQADRWIAVALRAITSALDPAASEEAWDWLYDGRIKTRRVLLRSEPCTVSVTNTSTRITWTARPALFVPLAHRHGVELPDRADEFSSYASD